MSRWLGIDHGTRRIGVAAGSTADGIAGPVEVIPAEPADKAIRRIQQLAEDYRVVATADGCHLTWIMAMKPQGLAGRFGMFAGRPVMGLVFQRFLHNLRRYTDERFAVR